MAATSAPVRAVTHEHRAGLAPRRVALVVGGVWLALLVVAVPLALAPSGSGFVSAPLWVTFGAVGLVVIWHQPRNSVGWLLFGVALFFTVESDASGVSVLDYRLHRGWPFGSLAVLLQPTWALVIVCAGLSLVLFPDGRLPSRRWRLPLWVFLALGGLWQLGAFAIAVSAVVRNDIHVDSAGNLLEGAKPHGNWAWWGDLQSIFFAYLGVLLIGWLLWQIPRYRRSTGEDRLQLKWLLSGAAIFVTSGALLVSLSSESSGVLGAVGHVSFLGLLAFPICIGVGILKYRLYEIDRLISRTLSYAILTGLLLGLFAGLVLLSTRVLPFSSPVGVAGSTLVAAALFNPLRTRVQRLVDRRFNRSRYDAQATVAAFSGRLRDALELDSIRRELIHAIDQAVAPAHASLWVRPPKSPPGS